MMKKIFLKAASLSIVLALAVACNEKKQEAVATATVIDKEQVKKEIQAKEDAFAETYNNGELKNIGYYADDATSYYQNREPLVGKGAILSFLQADIEANSNKITFKTNEVFVSNDGNMVVELGSFKVTDSTNTALNVGNYMTMFEKRDGKYVAVRDMSTSNGGKLD